jgi:TatA/E family protein of Tat protein translocase
MGEFSITHILLLGIIALIFFGPSRLPALGQSLGKAIKGFKQGLTEIDAEVKPVVEDNKQLPDQQRNVSPGTAQTSSSESTTKEKQNS